MGRIHGLGVQDENVVLRNVLLHVTWVSIVISVTYTYVMMNQGGGYYKEILYMIWQGFQEKINGSLNNGRKSL